MNYTLQPRTLEHAHTALKAAIIKAALDGRWADKTEMETSLADITAALVGMLAPRPHTVRCHLSIEELCDIEGAVKHYQEHVDASFPSTGSTRVLISVRLGKLLDRVRTTLKLNRPIGKEPVT